MRFLIAHEGEEPVGDHAHQTIGEVQIGRFELQQLTVQIATLSQHHAETAISNSERRREDFRLAIWEVRPEFDCVGMHFAGFPCCSHERTVFPTVAVADRIVGVERGSGLRTSVGDHHERLCLIVCWDEQEDVA